MRLSTEALLSIAANNAYIDAAELVSPNAHEFDSTYDRLYATYSAPVYTYDNLRDEGYSHEEALLKAGMRDPH